MRAARLDLGVTMTYSYVLQLVLRPPWSLHTVTIVCIYKVSRSRSALIPHIYFLAVTPQVVDLLRQTKIPKPSIWHHPLQPNSYYHAVITPGSF